VLILVLTTKPDKAVTARTAWLFPEQRVAGQADVSEDVVVKLAQLRT